MRTIISMLCACLAGAVFAGSTPPTRIILDTDIGGDYDDVGAMAVLHALADNGECEILAVCSSTLSRDAAPCIEILNAYYDRAFLPIGAPDDWPEKERACGENDAVTFD